MRDTHNFDVIVVGGGIAGTTFAGVLARSGLGVLVVEKEARFRDRLREGHERAKQQDPSLGGIALIEARGPDGLVADDAARRMYFGEHLA